MIAQLALASLLLAGTAEKGAAGRLPAHNGAATHLAASRSAGTVTGHLRHKGCQTPAAGARVSVIGCEVSAAADAQGNFSLNLPPGTYSLVISGPNLVADQRVDEVTVVLGRENDLGAVEVWPEERPPGCVTSVLPESSNEAVLAMPPDTPSVDLPGAGVAPTPVAPDQVLVRGGAGTGPSQFGLSGDTARDDEDVLGPSSFAIGPQGGLWVCDAVNGRVLRFDAHGRPAGAFPLAHTGAEWPPLESDLVVAEDGASVLLFSAGEPSTLAQYDHAGRLLVAAVLPPSLKGVDLLFPGKHPVLLMQNGQAVRVDLAWGGIRAEALLPGLPVGEGFVAGERVSRWRAAVKFITADGRVRRSLQLHSHVPVTGVRVAGVNRRGNVVVAVDRAETGEEPAPRAEILLLEVNPRGHLAGWVSVPPGDRRFEFREFALAQDGSVIQMQSDASEVRFVRWTLAPFGPATLAGEGLVKGRVLEEGRPSSDAAVLVGWKPRRSIPVGPDGSFEVRLPAGTYQLTFRRPGGHASLELKVAVGAGATVDLGNVSITTRSGPAVPPLEAQKRPDREPAGPRAAP